MPLYIGDYLSDTMHLTTEQHGAYFLLLLAYWKNRGPLPDDDAQFCRITRLMRDAWATHRTHIAPFFQIRDGFWHHKRVDLELAKAQRNKESRTSAATRAAFVRWNRTESSQDSKVGMSQTTMRDACVTQCVTHTPSPSEISPSLPREKGAAKGGGIPSLEQVKAAVMTTGIPDGFVEMVYETWASRSGKDGAGVVVEVVAYVRKRWRKEQVEWRDGTHRQKGNQTHGAGRQSGRASVNRNQATRNKPDRYSPENLRKLPNYHGADEIPNPKPGASTAV